MYRDMGAPNITQLYPHTSQTKSEKSESNYDSRPPEDLYEDPDGLKLVSFTDNQEQR